MKFFKATLSSILGSFIGGGIIALLLILFVSSLFRPSSPGLELEQPHFLHLKLNGPIREKSDLTPLRLTGLSLPELGSTTGLYEIRQALQIAAEDERIAGIFLEVDQVDAGWATLTSLREALLKFKASGKPIHAWADRGDERSLYLNSVADEFVFHPSGYLELNGFATTPYFLAEGLEKFGLQVRAFRVGQYKSGIEPYTATGLSEASREQLSVLLGDIWQHFADSLGESRTLKAGELEALANSFGTMASPRPALNIGLVDGLRPRHAFQDDLWNAYTKQVAEVDPQLTEGKVPLVRFSDYQEATYREAPRMKDEPKIAVIFMEGTIVDGQGGSGEIGGDRYAGLIRKARMDPSVKAIVLRVNSPGGSSLASALIADEIQAARKNIPVIASMGDLAASGGYYISAPCNRIFAQPQTVTGSIGVYSLSFQTQKLMEEQFGVYYDRVVTHSMADLNNPNRAPLPQEDSLMQAGVDAVYDDFLAIVQEGRNFESREAVHEIAQGRVWSGVRALDIGLVDELGGLEQALAHAKELSGLEQAPLWLLPQKPSSIQQLAESLSVLKIEPDLLSPELQEVLSTFRNSQTQRPQPGVYMRMEMDLDIR